MNVNVEDYLTHDEIKEIVTSEIQRCVAKSYSDNKEYFLGNLSYSAVAKTIIDLDIDPHPIEMLRKNVINLMMSKNTASFLFTRKGRYDGENGRGFDLINQVFDENKEELRSKIEGELKGSVWEEVKKDLQGVMITAFQDYIADCYGIVKKDN